MTDIPPRCSFCAAVACTVYRVKAKNTGAAFANAIVDVYACVMSDHREKARASGFVMGERPLSNDKRYRKVT
jgi:hypothetical protein